MTAGKMECSTDLCLAAGGAARNIGGLLESSVADKSAGDGNATTHEITMFYGGRVCVCDATEIQARAIISMARREMEETMRRKVRRSPPYPAAVPAQIKRPEPRLLNPGLSMKKSLQRFLQKRKTRVCGNSPYQYQKKDQNLYPEASDSSSFS